MEITCLDKTTAHLLENVAPDVFDNEIDASSVEAFLGCPRHAMLLAIDDGLVIGMVSGVEYFHPDKQRQFWINEIAVTPNRRNQGIGRSLINEIISLAIERGCVNAWLGTEQTNLPANRCFSQISNGNPPQKFVLYEWDSAKKAGTT